MDYYCKLELDKFYHIYNRANNGVNLFYKNDNYTYFLKKFDEYLSAYVETYAFSLLPNHFHFLIRIKTEEEKTEALNDPAKLLGASDKLITPRIIELKKDLGYDKEIVEAFRRFYTSYSKSIIKQQSFTGNLFNHRFKRKEVNNRLYLRNIVQYIHMNPQLHGIIEDYKLYPWSSYKRVLDDRPTRLKKNEVLEWFNGKENYIKYHSNIENLNECISLHLE